MLRRTGFPVAREHHIKTVLTVKIFYRFFLTLLHIPDNISNEHGNRLISLPSLPINLDHKTDVRFVAIELVHHGSESEGYHFYTLWGLKPNMKIAASHEFPFWKLVKSDDECWLSKSHAERTYRFELSNERYI
jgi:hypothetical protein